LEPWLRRSFVLSSCVVFFRRIVWTSGKDDARREDKRPPQPRLRWFIFCNQTNVCGVAQTKALRSPEGTLSLDKTSFVQTQLGVLGLTKNAPHSRSGPNEGSPLSGSNCFEKKKLCPDPTWRNSASRKTLLKREGSPDDPRSLLIWIQDSSPFKHLHSVLRSSPAFDLQEPWTTPDTSPRKSRYGGPLPPIHQAWAALPISDTSSIISCMKLRHGPRNPPELEV